MNARTFRPLATSLVALSTLVLAATGLVMVLATLTRPQMHMTRQIHEWFGYLFLAAVAVHLLFNARAMVNMACRRSGAWQWAASLAGSALLLFAAIHFSEPPERPRHLGGGRGRQDSVQPRPRGDAEAAPAAERNVAIGEQPAPMGRGPQIRRRRRAEPEAEATP